MRQQQTQHVDNPQQHENVYQCENCGQQVSFSKSVDLTVESNGLCYFVHYHEECIYADRTN